MSPLNEIVTFEKWISQEFGPDMPKQILDNGYINYGPMRHVFEYLFNNVYSDKFARIVKLNLKQEAKTGLKSKLKENEDYQQLRKRKLELNKKLDQLRQKTRAQAEESAQLIQHIGECEASVETASADLVNRQANLMRDESTLRRAKQLKSKIEQASERLSVVLDSSLSCSATAAAAANATSLSSTMSNVFENQHITNELKKEDIENLMHTFRKLNGSLGESKQQPTATLSLNQRKLSKLSVSDCLKCYETKIEEELANLHNILDERHLDNEIGLLVYQVVAKNQFLFDESQSVDSKYRNLDLENVIADNYHELIKKECEMIKFKRECEQNETHTNNVKAKLNEYFKKQYSGAELQLYGRYLRSYLMAKRYEVNLAELKQCSEEFQREAECLKQSCSNLLADNWREIAELLERVNAKQAHLDTLVTGNLVYLTTRFQVDVSQLKQSSEWLLDSLRTFNGQLAENTGTPSSAATGNRNDFSVHYASQANSTMMIGHCSLSSRPFRPSKQQQQASGGWQLTLDQSHVRLSQIEAFLNFDSQAKARCFMFNELVKSCIDSDRMLSKLMSDESSALLSCQQNALIDYSGGESAGHRTAMLCAELDDLVGKCVKSDRVMQQAYLETIKSKLTRSGEQNEYLAKVEKLVDIWWKQPAANECILENYYVNAKTLGYYLNRVDEAIVAATASRKMLF